MLWLQRIFTHSHHIKLHKLFQLSSVLNSICTAKTKQKWTKPEKTTETVSATVSSKIEKFRFHFHVDAYTFSNTHYDCIVNCQQLPFQTNWFPSPASIEVDVAQTSASYLLHISNRISTTGSHIRAQIHQPLSPYTLLYSNWIIKDTATSVRSEDKKME